ncbi:hypothetical protein Gogos_005148 [Gossypium gossypioides]|uniref:RNase H type-1 domain-containing protein n=1 Tax=Gossypium gossypioides TaxID=34282 RepID=A0A7J9CIY3_GOSGO|nr:hypothetical protein [Gossypium gossypioides]
MICTVLEAELWGIFHCLSIAWEKGFKKVLVECDSSQAAQLLNDGQAASDNLALKFGQPKGLVDVEFVEVDAVQNTLPLNESDLRGPELKVCSFSVYFAFVPLILQLRVVLWVQSVLLWHI